MRLTTGIIGIIIIALMMTTGPGGAWGGVEVTRDQYGIPSIKAETEEELFEEFGYITAADRLWQMEVNRRWGRGTLAEIFGANLVPVDMQNRLMNYTEEEYQSMFDQVSSDGKNFYRAYLRGVNRRVDEVNADPKLMPMEYLALKLKPGHFTVSDIFGFMKELLRRFGMIGGSEMNNLNALQILTGRYGRIEGRAIFDDWRWINDPSAPTYIEETISGDFTPRKMTTADIPAALGDDTFVARWVKDEAILDRTAFREARRVGAPVKLGSTTWTLSPGVTGTGFPILVGQPQMGHTVPSIIMEVALKGGRFDVVGMSFPLWPSIPIGHNHFLAWSHMVGMCDNVDVYQEILNPLNKEEYLFNGKWRKMEKRTEEIKVAGGEAQKVTIYRTVHGPVFSPFPFDPNKAEIDKVYSKKLAHWRIEALSGDAWWKMMAAENASEFGRGVSMIMTSLHTSYADIHGNIGYWHTGLNPERPDGYDPRLPLPGTGEAEWTGKYLSNASVINPDRGYVTGWNNKASPDTRNPDGKNPDYLFGRHHRALWLLRALKDAKGMDLKANNELIKYQAGANTYYPQVNAYGIDCKDFIPAMAGAIKSAGDADKQLLNKMVQVLSSWDGRSVVDVVNDDHFQAGQTIFLDWLPRAVQATFEDELADIEDFKLVRSGLFNLFLRCIDGPTATLPVSRNYFDNTNTKKIETIDDVFLKSLMETAAAMKEKFKNEDPTSWQDPRSKILYKHNMFGQVAEMWDNNIGTYVQIVELRPTGAVGYSRWPLGQSGHISPGADGKPVFDPHFFDMLPHYQNHTYQKMGMD
jgi:penicillin amidase